MSAKAKAKLTPEQRKATLTRVLHKIRPYSLFVVCSLIVAAVSVAAQLYIPILCGDAIDLMLGKGNVAFAGVGRIIVEVLVVAVAAAFAQWLLSVCNNRITFSVSRDLRNEALRKIQTLPLSYLDSHPSGDIVSRMVADVDTFADGLLMGFTQLFSGVLTILGTLLFMLSENVAITGCILHSRDSALKIGTETHGVIRNVTLSDCVIDDCSRAVGVWVRDGGTVENIQVHHLVGAVRRYADRYSVPGAPGWWGKGEALFVNATRRAGQDNFPGVIRNVSFDHITMKAESCLFFAGESYAPLYNIRAEAVDLTLCRQGTQPGGLFDEQPSARHLYPHEIPALYARCVQGLRVRDCRVRSGGPGDWSGRPALLEDCPGAVVELDAE